jgi:hypothetical protein
MTAEQRRSLLVAALGFLQLERRHIIGCATALHGRAGLAALHARLDNWRGIGLVVEGWSGKGSESAFGRSTLGWRASGATR